LFVENRLAAPADSRRDDRDTAGAGFHRRTWETFAMAREHVDVEGVVPLLDEPADESNDRRVVANRQLAADPRTRRRIPAEPSEVDAVADVNDLSARRDSLGFGGVDVFAALRKDEVSERSRDAIKIDQRAPRH